MASANVVNGYIVSLHDACQDHCTRGMVLKLAEGSPHTSWREGVIG